MNESQGSDFVDWIAIRKLASSVPTTTLGSPIQVHDMVATKSVTPTVPNRGGPITYILAFTNTGAISAASAVIIDQVPVSVTNPIETSPNCSLGAPVTERGGTPFVWDVANLQIGEVCVITVTGELSGTLPEGHVFTNKVIAMAGDNCPCNSSDAATASVNHYPDATATVNTRDISLCDDTGVLYGDTSIDVEDGTALAYEWKQVGGEPTDLAVLNNPFTPTTNFTTPCATEGIVTFTLTVTDSGGLTDTDTITVMAKNVPVAGLSVASSSPAIPGRIVYFTATITDGSSVTYTWNFGDGNIGYSNDLSHVSYITHAYYKLPSNGITYTVIVTASNGFITGAPPVYTNYTDTATTTVTIIIAWPIPGKIWNDSDDNSQLDIGELGIADIRMFLYREYSGCVASAITDNNGVYTFTNVITGDYQVVEAYGYSSLGLDSIATFAATKVVTPCNPASLATDPPGHASNTPNVQWITLYKDGSIDNRVSPSLWPITLTNGVNFGDEEANAFSQCEDAFQTKGTSENNIQLFRLDMLEAEFDIYPEGSASVYNYINSIGFNQVDNFIYGFRRDLDRFTRIDADGQWTELTITDGFVPSNSYLGDINDEGYWVLGDNGQKNLEIVDVDPARPTFLMVINTVMLNTNLTGADFAWNVEDDNFYVIGGYQSRDLYRITFTGPVEQAGTSATMTKIADVNAPGTGGSGAQYFDKNGGFYFYPNDTGELYKISNVEDIVAVSQVTPTLIATGDSVNLNDGCGCAPTIEFEYGDAPASYEPYNKARHNYIFEAGIYLGSHQDGELEAQNSSDALGDDNDGIDDEGDDEDGVTREGADFYDQALWANSDQFYTLTIDANKAGYLNVWIDLNGNGDWADPDEQIATDLPLNAGINYAPTFSVTDHYTGVTFMRFRFTNEKAPTATVGIGGVVTHGEVEDYLITIDDCADLELTKTVVPTTPLPGGSIVTFTVLVSNSVSSAVPECDGDATKVEVTDQLPSGYSYESYTATQGTYSYTTGIWYIGTITHNTAVSLEIVTLMKGGDLENVAEVTDSGAFDPDSTPDNHRPEEDDQARVAAVLLPIGGTVYLVAVLAPWIALAAIVAVTVGGVLLAKRRRLHR